MSVAKKSNHRAQRRQSAAVPELTTAKGLTVLAAAMITGLLLSIMNGAIAWPFFLCFILAAVMLSIFIEKQGLFLLVASVPLFFFSTIVVTGWLISRSSAPEGASPFSKTVLLTSSFPLVENFPILAIGTAGALVIALLRLWREKVRSRSENERARVSRRTAAEADRKARSERLSVAELLARNQLSQEAQPRARNWGRDREQRRREQAAERGERLRRQAPPPAPPLPDPNRRAGDAPAPPRSSHRLRQPSEDNAPSFEENL